MKREIRLFIYNMLHSRFMFVIFFLMCLLTGFLSPLWISQLGGVSNTASGLLAVDSSVSYSFTLMLMCVPVAYLCAGDMKDRVINYEVMSGHSRLSIYFSRTILTVLFTTLLSLILSFVPVIVGIIIYGWGDNMEFGYAMIRLLFCAFPYMRMAAFICFLAFLVKKATGVMVWGYMVYVFGAFTESLGTKIPYMTAFKNAVALLEFKTRSVYNISMDGGIVNYAVYQSKPEAGLLLTTAVVSLLMTVIYLLMGYGLFRRDDLN